MKITESIRTILKSKSPEIWSLPPDATVYQAVALMNDKNIGAVLIMEGDALLGIMSERDYTRKVVLKDRSSNDTTVREIMSSPVVSTSPECTLEDCMRLVTSKRVRHLPVLDQGKLIGIVSIGDLVNAIISAQSDTIHQLEGYISGKYPS